MKDFFRKHKHKQKTVDSKPMWLFLIISIRLNSLEAFNLFLSLKFWLSKWPRLNCYMVWGRNINMFRITNVEHNIYSTPNPIMIYSRQIGAKISEPKKVESFKTNQPEWHRFRSDSHLSLISTNVAKMRKRKTIQRQYLKGSAVM